jgi:hypothetical protein
MPRVHSASFVEVAANCHQFYPVKSLRGCAGAQVWGVTLPTAVVCGMQAFCLTK